MHPAATRSIRIPIGRVSAATAMRDILAQYGALIEQRREKVRENTPAGMQPDMRTGWLLWQESLRQFLYFEERMAVPNADAFTAEWVEGSGGSRKDSRNLWIYERATGKKRYSVTTAAGAKIQPYFDVPPPNDPHLYIFTVIGEVITDGRVRCWISRTTRDNLAQLIGSASPDAVAAAIERTLASLPIVESRPVVADDPAEPLEISESAYSLLTTRLPGTNDDHCFQQLVRILRRNA